MRALPPSVPAELALGGASDLPGAPDAPTLQLFQEDMFEGIARLPDGSVDLVVADPPYGLGKDYGNDSDLLSGQAYLEWSERWMDAVCPKLAPKGTLYLFCTWQYSPELFVMLKRRLTMINEIIWDRRVPSMGGTTRKFSSVHDNIGFFARARDYYFDLDPVRIPYDPETKKARSRPRFEGKKWLEVGYNPKDLWSISRIHRQDPERANHPTQKPLEIVERMVLSSCPPGGLVLDPFAGSGTTAVACLRHGRRFVGFEINPEYVEVARGRVDAAVQLARSVADRNPTSAAANDEESSAQLPHLIP
ncbi:Modification methylase RsrI [Cupriavidus laharis]|uniref:Methyltransferase n=1 Tax=Cupriavidus laharis TaxID=151654 RepID=A0ABN7YHL6_9BURK|nr:site-specific DNA-methyltransferase [Cupriavidus laharis]CAG9171656.1 Modification methylase RsrI [Cupriavidus laharis]